MRRTSQLLALLGLFTPPLAAQGVVPFRPGMVVTESVRIAPGTYHVSGSPTLDSALIVVRGDDLTLDLTGVILEGIPASSDPDMANGIAVLVDGGRDVTVRGGTIRGYGFAILARETRGLTLSDNDLSYNWKPRLFSRPSHESIADWLSYHDNDDGEWMRYRAAIFLQDVTGGQIAGNRSVQGMNALLMTRTDSVVITGNEFTFNSGLGIGLFRSNANSIIGNRLDYNVRGYSHGIYQRGQDSAGILLYGQSSHNVVAFNSATHSGDGLFLWAGRHTMDTGEGGANDNLIFHNDFSYAPTNGIEVTFSRNELIGNIVKGSRYGVWGGYSWETTVSGNCFAHNEFGVAIEHGQDNRIVGNRFDGDSLVVSLWARESEPADWGYSRYRDTRSRDNVVSDNLMAGNTVLWRLERTERADTAGNTISSHVPPDECRPRDLMGAAFDTLAATLVVAPTQIPTSAVASRPRSAIVVDQWGPYDWASPRALRTTAEPGVAKLATLGPAGTWRITGRRGVAGTSLERGAMGDTLELTLEPGAIHDWSVDLEYVGESSVSSRGIVTDSGTPVPFGYEYHDRPLGWDVKIFDWDDSSRDPHLDPEALDALLSGPESLVRREDRLRYIWFRPQVEGIPRERWAMEARATLDVPEGDYSLRTISDDGIRVWIDDELVIDNWEAHGSTVDYAALLPGRHAIRVLYYQLDGWAEVQVDMVRGSSRSTGSPGPH